MVEERGEPFLPPLPCSYPGRTFTGWTAPALAGAEWCCFGLDFGRLPASRTRHSSISSSHASWGEGGELSARAFFEFPNAIRRLHAGPSAVRPWSCCRFVSILRWSRCGCGINRWQPSQNYLHVYLAHRETTHAKMTPLNTNGLAIAPPMNLWGL